MFKYFEHPKTGHITNSKHSQCTSDKLPLNKMYVSREEVILPFLRQGKNR